MAARQVRRVLIADDDASWLGTLRRELERLGCAVDTAANYIGARERLDKRAYTLIVCDNRMPISGEARPNRTCGLQLLAYAKAHGHNQKTPFVLHTSDDDTEVIEVVQKLGGVYRSKDTGKDIGDFLKKMLPTPA